MSRRADPRLVGAFVLGAVVIVVLGLLALGTGRDFFHKSDRFVVYFHESLRGLHIGAPVAFRGVDIGDVKAIHAYFDKAGTNIEVPVVIELRRDAVLLEDGKEPTPAVMKLLIDKGARAQLRAESVLTGRQYVGIDFFPGTPATMVKGPVDLPQIPSTPSPFAGLLRSLDDVSMTAPDLVRTAGDVLHTAQQFLAGQPGRDLASILHDTAAVAHQLGDPDGPLAGSLAALPPLASKLSHTADGLDQLVSDLQPILRDRNTQLTKLLGDLDDTSGSIRRASDQLAELTRENRPGIKDFTTRGLPELSGLIEDATRTVNELDGTLRDLRQDPARFFFGNQTQQGVHLR
jgi:paraquat-inducible protein B